MRWNFELLSSNNCLRVATEGTFTLEEQSRMFLEIQLFDQWQPEIPILFDNRHIEMKEVNLEIIRKSVEIMQRFSHNYPVCRIAGLVNEGLNFGLGRQFEIVTELEGGTGFRLFKSERMALEWLLKG